MRMRFVFILNLVMGRLNLIHHARICGFTLLHWMTARPKSSQNLLVWFSIASYGFVLFHMHLTFIRAFYGEQTKSFAHSVPTQTLLLSLEFIVCFVALQLHTTHTHTYTLPAPRLCHCCFEYEISTRIDSYIQCALIPIQSLAYSCILVWVCDDILISISCEPFLRESVCESVWEWCRPIV